MVSSSSQSKRFYQFLCIKCNYKGDRLTQQKIFILRRPSRAIKTKNPNRVRDSEEGFCWIFLKKWDFLLRKTFFWKPVLWSLSSNNIHRFCLKVWSFYRSRDNQKYCYICFYIHITNVHIISWYLLNPISVGWVQKLYPPMVFLSIEKAAMSEISWLLFFS